MRYTVCPAITNTQTSYIAWNDAEQAAATGADPVSPYKAGTPSDREWVRHFYGAIASPSGFTPSGHRIIRN